VSETHCGTGRGPLCNFSQRREFFFFFPTFNGVKGGAALKAASIKVKADSNSV